MFGPEESDSTTLQHLEAVQRWVTVIESPDEEDNPIQFPVGNVPEVFSAIINLGASTKIAQLTPFPRLASRLVTKLPYMRAAAIKDHFVRQKISEAVRCIEQDELEQLSAVISVLLREKEVATKEGRLPEYHRRGIYDELFGSVLGGFDTMATTASWGIKYLTDNKAIQERLRTDLRAALPQAVQEKRMPTYQELVKVHLPYLDAVIDEILLHSDTIPFIAREALQDTTVMGYHVPKGTNLFLMGNGPGYLQPHLPVDNTMRSPGARLDSGKVMTGAWEDSGIGKFKPERWLDVDPETRLENYNHMAGPTMAFGLGPRGCYGRKLAFTSLRIQFALIIWNFRLLAIPDELGGYDAVQQLAREPRRCYIRLAKCD
jgi:cytochrome P450